MNLTQDTIRQMRNYLKDGILKLKRHKDLAVGINKQLGDLQLEIATEVIIATSENRIAEVAFSIAQMKLQLLRLNENLTAANTSGATMTTYLQFLHASLYEHKDNEILERYKRVNAVNIADTTQWVMRLFLPDQVSEVVTMEQLKNINNVMHDIIVVMANANSVGFREFARAVEAS